MVNHSKLTQAIFFVTVIALSAVALGTFDEVEAIHTEAPNVADPGYSQALVTGTNELSYRDSSNTSPQDPDSIIPVIDTSQIGTGSGFVTVTISEDDSNLDDLGIDVIFASMTSTTSGVDEQEFQLTESSVNSATFVGQVDVSRGSEPGKLRVSALDQLTVLYEPQHEGVGRLSATLVGATDGRDATLIDYTIDDPDGFDTRANEACPYNLVVHPVQIFIPFTAPDEIADAITVTISYANAVDVTLPGGPLELYLPGDLDLVYRPGTEFGSPSFFAPIDVSSPFVVDTVAKTITGTRLKGEIFPFISGQYALGVDVSGCTGGGGGGLVRSGLVVNALAGIGSLLSSSGGGSGPPGPTVTLGASKLNFKYRIIARCNMRCTG